MSLNVLCESLVSLSIKDAFGIIHVVIQGVGCAHVLYSWTYIGIWVNFFWGGG